MAFLGRSNVGKSRLLNALAGVRGLARVSAAPGRTRLANFFLVDDALCLVDLPGYGYARVPGELKRGFEGLVTACLARESLALCVFLVDARHEPTPDDEALGRWLEERRLPFVLAATKADKLARSARARQARLLAAGLGQGALEVLLTSAQDGTGVPELWRVIRRVTEAHAAGRRIPAGREA